jgi:flagellar biosynthesis protein FliR
MFGEGLGAASLAGWASLFALVVARLSVVVFLMPGIGEQVVSPRTRLFLLFGLSAAITASGIVTPPVSQDFGSYLAMLGEELMIGLMLGVSLRLVIWILSIAGSVIAQSIGLSQFLGVAIEQEIQTIISNLLSMAGVVVLLSADYHVAVFAGLIDLYTDVPAGFETDFAAPLLMSAIFSAFSFAILLAWPFVAMNLFYNICLGFINKALPQLMVAFVGAPFMVGAGLILLAISVSVMLAAWMDRIPAFVSWL